MDRDGLLLNIFDSVERINQGRKWQNTIGLESNGRATYQQGLIDAIDSFQSAQSQAAVDLKLVIQAEQTFILQELLLCDSTETDTISSLEQASMSFDDAMRVLEVVGDPILYKAVEKSYPTYGKSRYNKMPNDSFHKACLAHRTRLRNILRSPGIDLTEKQLLTQRLTNIVSAQSAYIEMQKTSLGI